jgi:gamma-glutamyl-gamma-aminobutyrate hydrolase PuuD
MFFERGYPLVNRPNDADILCFIGGADIDPALYGQKKNPVLNVNTSMTCDLRDKAAWEDRKDNQLVVGICRGGQFANCMSGGSMLQHVVGHHRPHIAYDTVWNTQVIVSSCHHQMMVPGPDAEVFAYAEEVASEAWDDTKKIEVPKVEPEVLWYEKTKSLCFQGHPEWNPRSASDYFFRLLELVKDC